MKKIPLNFYEISVNELKSRRICDGHLYLKVGGKMIHIMNPGTLIDFSFVRKYSTHECEFRMDLLTSLSVQKKFLKLFKELHSMQFENEFRQKSQEMMEYFLTTFVSREHFLSFAIPCYQSFCLLPAKVQKEINDTDINLFRKSLYSAAFSVIIAVANGFYHFSILRDLYNLTFSLDLGLCNSTYSHFISLACDRESKAPGKGIKFLESNGASNIEIEYFLQHPRRSYDVFKDLSLLTFPSLINVLLYQHELLNGYGFPLGIGKNQISSWDSVVILSDSLASINSQSDFEDNVIDHLLTFKLNKRYNLPVHDVYLRLRLALNFFKNKKEVTA